MYNEPIIVQRGWMHIYQHSRHGLDIHRFVVHKSHDLTGVDESIVSKKKQLGYSKLVGNRLKIDRATAHNANHFLKSPSFHRFDPNKT